MHGRMTPVVIATFAFLASVVVIGLAGVRMVRSSSKSPMWHARRTADTFEDKPESGHRHLSARRLTAEFAALATLLGGAGYVLARTAAMITRETALSESVMGGAFTAAASSLPELVVVITAVRTGAHTLAVSNIIGGNALDTLFLFFADLAYTDGSIYHAISRTQEFFLILTILMTGVLLLGLVRRQRHGWWRIGFESLLIFAIYAGALIALVWMGD